MRKYFSIVSQITANELQWFVDRSHSFNDLGCKLGYGQSNRKVFERVTELGIDYSHFKSVRIPSLLKLGKKFCHKCNKVKDREQFNNHVGALGGKAALCKDCLKKTRVRYSKEYNKNIRLKSDFGITLEEYTEMLKAQNYVCAICFQPETKTDRRSPGVICTLSVDHCHTTGEIRGLLCNNCNRCLGLLKDSPIVLQSAIDYLNRQ